MGIMMVSLLPCFTRAEKATAPEPLLGKMSTMRISHHRSPATFLMPQLVVNHPTELRVRQAAKRATVKLRAVVALDFAALKAKLEVSKSSPPPQSRLQRLEGFVRDRI